MKKILFLLLLICASLPSYAQDGTCNTVTKSTIQSGFNIISGGNMNVTGGSERITNGTFNSPSGDMYIWPASGLYQGNLTGWTATGGGDFTYGQVLVGAYGVSGTSNKVYFGNAFGTGSTGYSGVTWNSNNIVTNASLSTFTNCDTLSYGTQHVALSQTIATTVGKTYRLSFSTNPETGPTGDPAGFFGLGITGYSTVLLRYGNGWIPWAFEFVATSTSTTITFTNTDHIQDAACGFSGTYGSEIELAEVSVKSCAAVAASPTLNVTKSNPSPSLAVGTNSTYTITVSNSGTGSATGATIKDAIPAGLTLVSTSGTNWSCTPSSGASPVGTITCTYSASIAAGASASALSVVVNPTASVAGTSVTNYVSTDPTGGASPPTATTCTAANTPTAGCGAPVVSAIPAIPDLTIAKTHTGTFTAGGTGTYNLTVNNIGGAASSGAITVADTLPVGLSVNGGAVGAVTLTGTNAASWTCNSNSASPQIITCTSATAIAATTGTSTFSFVVNIAAGASGTLTNNVSVSGGGESNTSNNTASDPVTIGAATSPTLNVTKSNPSPSLAVGTNSTYTITVSNSGTGSATGATIKDAIPAGLTLVSTSGTNWSCTPSSGASPVGTITCTYSASIAAGASASALSVVVNPAASVAGTSVTNFVSTDPTGGASPPTATTCTAANTPTAGCGAPVVSAIPAIPDLTIAKSHTGTFTAGGTGTYNLTVNNIGGAASSGTITVADTLPVGLSVNGGAVGAVTLTGTNAASWTCNSNAASPQIITCTSSTAIAATTGTSTFSFVVNIAAGASGTLTNNVSVSGGGESNTSNNTASDPVTIGAAGTSPTITLAKSCTSPATCTTAPQIPGTDLAYNIIYTNSGTASAISLIIIDFVPTNTDFKVGSGTSSPGTTGLTFVIEYSNDNGATWTYTPTSGGGGAASGYDRNVKVVRWRVTAGTLSNTAPNNTGSVGFTAKIR